jgi:hypothetical protein
VTVTGSATQGQTLTASNSIADVDGIPAAGLDSIHYQWLADGVNISGATSNTIVLSQALAGKAISAVASYVDLYGTHESVTSNLTGKVLGVYDGARLTVDQLYQVASSVSGSLFQGVSSQGLVVADTSKHIADSIISRGYDDILNNSHVVIKATDSVNPTLNMAELYALADSRVDVTYEDQSLTNIYVKDTSINIADELISHKFGGFPNSLVVLTATDTVNPTLNMAELYALADSRVDVTYENQSLTSIYVKDSAINIADQLILHNFGGFPNSLVTLTATDVVNPTLNMAELYALLDTRVDVTFAEQSISHINVRDTAKNIADPQFRRFSKQWTGDIDSDGCHQPFAHCFRVLYINKLKS